jgi:hypothetical protein
MDAVVDLRTACPGTTIDCEDNGGGEGATEVLHATGLTIGNTYYLRVYDYTGASNPPTTTTFTICITTPCSQPVKPIISGTNTICSGQSSQLSITNPCSSCTFTWSNGATGSSVSITTAGNYKVTATNNCGSISSDPYGVTVNNTPQTVISNLSNAYCIASGSATLGATPSGGTFSGNGISGNVFSPSVAGVGTHTVTYTVSQNGCTGTTTQSVTVSASPLVQITAGSSTSFCNGGSVTLTATQGSAYSWSNGAITQSIAVNQTGSFNVTVTNPGGCNASVAAVAPVSVAVYPNPVALAGADQTLLQVQSNSVTIGGAPTALGGTSPYGYQWSPVNGLNASNVANPVVSNLSTATVYTVTVTDANNCTATDDVLVSVSSLCTYTAQPAFFSFTAASGTDSFYVSVSDTNCGAWDVTFCNWLSMLSPSLPSNNSGWLTFSVSANTDTAQRTCVISLTGGQNIIVVQNGAVANPCQPPLTTPVVQLNFCDLAADLIPNVSYQWYNNGNSISGANTRFYTASQSGYYYVVIADSNFCSAQSQDVYVSFPSCNGTGVEETRNEILINIYPNPINGESVWVSTSIPLKNTELKLFDVAGRLMESVSINKTPAEISIADFSAGVYVVQLRSYTGEEVSARFLKLR